MMYSLINQNHSKPKWVFFYRANDWNTNRANMRPHAQSNKMHWGKWWNTIYITRFMHVLLYNMSYHLYVTCFFVLFFICNMLYYVVKVILLGFINQDCTSLYI